MPSQRISLLASTALCGLAIGLSGCSGGGDGAAKTESTAGKDAPSAGANESSSSKNLVILPPSPDAPEESAKSGDEPFAKLNLPRPVARNDEDEDDNMPFDAADAVHRGPWIQSFETAKAQAKAEGKDILMDFTGSDWCGWCIRLNKEVFSTKEFIDYAPKKFVLLELDFPRSPSKRAKQSAEIQQQNEKLQEKFQVEGFPTIVLADASGRPYAIARYEPGGPEAYIPYLEDFRKLRVARDEAFAKAYQAKGVERAKFLDEGLRDLPPEIVLASYRTEVDEIVKLDANNAGGVQQGWKEKLRAADFEPQLNELLQGLGSASGADEALKLVAEAQKKHQDYPAGLRKLRILNLSVLHTFDKKAEFNAGVDELLKDKSFEGMERYQLYMMKMSPLAEAKAFADAEQVVVAALKELGDHETYGVNLHMMRARLLKSQGKSKEGRASVADARKLADPKLHRQIDQFAEALFGSDEEESAPEITPKTKKPADEAAGQ